MRKIPVTMATQHPDNAGVSPFSGQRFVSTSDELDECARCFSELGVHEYMWDWEGKFVDEAVIDRLYQNHHEFFQQQQIGRDLFLTFRIPNIWEEKAHHRLQRAFMNLISAEQAAIQYGFHSPPLFEVIQPMTTSADQLIHLQRTFSRIAEATEKIFNHRTELRHLELIPLFEEVETMANSDKILEQYVEFLLDEYDFKPEYLRVFIARSDPAMNAGLIPTMLAVKHAISNYHAFGERNNIRIYPWIGGGSLPFRGAINPENVLEAVEEYRGAASITVQSAFRTDYPLEQVIETIGELNQRVPLNLDKYERVTSEQGERIETFNHDAAEIFKGTIEPLADFVNTVAARLPNHRERVQHIGLFGYSRGVGKVRLPRAIKFTGAFYSVGIPPEFIATGRALRLAQETDMLDLIEMLYLNLRRDLVHAGKYFNRENLEILCRENSAWEPIRQDIGLIEEILGIRLGPETDYHFLHRNHSSNVFRLMRMNEDFAEDLLKAAERRRSLG
jgi:phosphoenolpyruvate carboxylase